MQFTLGKLLLFSLGHQKPLENIMNYFFLVCNYLLRRCTYRMHYCIDQPNANDEPYLFYSKYVWRVRCKRYYTI